jgi:tol-pal system protein YbgF
MTALLGLSVSLGGLSTSACGGAQKEDTLVANKELGRKVSELRAQLRRDRMRIRELERELYETAPEPTSPTVASRDIKGLPKTDAPVEVIFEDVGAVIDAPEGRESTRVFGVDPHGVEIRYAGEALQREPSRKLTNADIKNRRSFGSSLEANDPVAPLPDVPEDDIRLPVLKGAVPKVDERIHASVAPPPIAAAPPAASGPAKARYQESIEALELGDYARAVGSLRKFLKDHPGHELADNAQYWLGEAFYAQKQYSSALSAFRGVIDKFPTGNKVPDAYLKVGYCLVQLKDIEAARGALEKVKKDYPGTSPASLAAKKLAEIKK